MLMNFRIKAGEYGLLRNDFRWEGIPPLAIVTGPNGVGKTQLLRALGAGLGATSSEWNVRSLKVEVALEDGTPAPAGTLLSSEWPSMSDAGRENFESLLRSITEFYQTGLLQVQHEHYEPYWRELENRSGKQRKDITKEEVVDYAPAHLLSKPHREAFYSFGRLFFTYHVFTEFARSKGESEADIIARLGPAPWDVLNEILTTSDLQFRVNQPMGGIPNVFGDLSYELQLYDVRSGEKIDLGMLSSGEKIIMSMALWRYVHSMHGDQPRTLLLDEPDAHLHPSLIQKFLNVLQQDFIEKWGYRVILTTHSPTTAALAPEGSLFQMMREPLRVIRADSRWTVVDRLSDGLVTIGLDTKAVFVEDVDDQVFYARLFEELVRPSGGRPGFLRLRPNIVFHPVHAATKDSTGGRRKIENLLQSLGPGTSIYGIADNDGDLTTTPGVLLTQRRMWENYIFDPLVVYGHLAAKERNPTLPGIPGRLNEREIRSLTVETKQEIVTHMLGLLRQCIEDPTLDESEVDVEFVDGSVLQYPAWFLLADGKRQLLPQRFTNDLKIMRDELKTDYWRVGMIPLDLAMMLRRIQGVHA
jgi:ABC-type transport system involved in cytochrome c biogenesis ATPase subunit